MTSVRITLGVVCYSNDGACAFAREGDVVSMCDEDVASLLGFNCIELLPAPKPEPVEPAKTLAKKK